MLTFISHHSFLLKIQCFIFISNPFPRSYLNNESVSWVRGRDSHILTVDSEVFISDERFHSQIQKLSNLWILKVKATTAIYLAN